MKHEPVQTSGPITNKSPGRHNAFSTLLLFIHKIEMDKRLFLPGNLASTDITDTRLPILLQVQLYWAGHVTRMEDVRMPNAVFFNELQEGTRDHGAPRKRYKDQLKRQLAQAGISHQPWQQEASDQHSWFSSVRKASCAVGGAHQESVSTATNEHAGTDINLATTTKSSSARN